MPLSVAGLTVSPDPPACFAWEEEKAEAVAFLSAEWESREWWVEQRYGNGKGQWMFCGLTFSFPFCLRPCPPRSEEPSSQPQAYMAMSDGVLCMFCFGPLKWVQLSWFFLNIVY